MRILPLLLTSSIRRSGPKAGSKTTRQAAHPEQVEGTGLGTAPTDAAVAAALSEASAQTRLGGRRCSSRASVWGVWGPEN